MLFSQRYSHALEQSKLKVEIPDVARRKLTQFIRLLHVGARSKCHPLPMRWRCPGLSGGDGSADERREAFAARGVVGFGSAAADERGGGAARPRHRRRL